MVAWQKNVSSPPMEVALGRLQQLHPLSESEQEQMRALGRQIERYAPGSQVYPFRAKEPVVGIVVSGWGCQLRILPDGRRQIFCFVLPGDCIELSSKVGLGDKALIAITPMEFVNATRLVEAAPGVRKAFDESHRLHGERLFDHIVRLGRQTAYERLGHLLLELRDRLRCIGQTKHETFRIPLTQENFADALGLSIVHVNRTLQQLRREGLIELKSGGVSLLKPRMLAIIAGYETHDEDEDELTFRPRGAEPQNLRPE